MRSTLAISVTVAVLAVAPAESFATNPTPISAAKQAVDPALINASQNPRRALQGHLRSKRFVVRRSYVVQFDNALQGRILHMERPRSVSAELCDIEPWSDPNCPGNGVEGYDVAEFRFDDRLIEVGVQEETQTIDVTGSRPPEFDS